MFLNFPVIYISSMINSFVRKFSFPIYCAEIGKNRKREREGGGRLSPGGGEGIF